MVLAINLACCDFLWWVYALDIITFDYCRVAFLVTGSEPDERNGGGYFWDMRHGRTGKTVRWIELYMVDLDGLCDERKRLGGIVGEWIVNQMSF